MSEQAPIPAPDKPAPIVVRIEEISEYEVEIPPEAFTEEWDLADYVNDTENWRQPAADGGLGDILLPPLEKYGSWRRIEKDYRTLPRDEAVHGKYGPTGFYLLGQGNRMFKTETDLLRALLAPKVEVEGEDD